MKASVEGNVSVLESSATANLWLIQTTLWNLYFCHIVHIGDPGKSGLTTGGMGP